MGRRITKEMIITDVKTASDKIGKIPTKWEYEAVGQYGKNTAIRRFGNWNNVIFAVFNTIVNPRVLEKVEVTCGWCGTVFKRVNSALSKNNFCCKSHAASYNNTKRRKSRRSRCECLLFDLLVEAFPQLTIISNDKSMLDGYEVDIAIPLLNLAIEWNGIVHFKPIYGKMKLDAIQKRDCEKQKIAEKKGVNLIIIPDLVSQKKYVQESFFSIKKIIMELSRLERETKEL